MKSGPIVIIEDDADDREILQDILQDIHIRNKLVWFPRADEAFSYLKTSGESPFIILCDINLPGQNGIEFKRQLDADPQLRTKSIPFIFYSTAVNQEAVNEAYTRMTVQGFFQKGNNYEEMKKDIQLILDYWNVCQHPNT